MTKYKLPIIHDSMGEYEYFNPRYKPSKKSPRFDILNKTKEITVPR